jgi:hypothetical protein
MVSSFLGGRKLQQYARNHLCKTTHKPNLKLCAVSTLTIKVSVVYLQKHAIFTARPLTNKETKYRTVSYIPSFAVNSTTDKQNSKIKIQVCNKLKVGDRLAIVRDRRIGTPVVVSTVKLAIFSL